MNHSLASWLLRLGCPLLAAASLLPAAAAQDFGFDGEAPGLTGSTSAVGPKAPRMAWRVAAPSDFTAPPLIQNGRVFTVQGSGPSSSPAIVVRDLASGAEIWRRTLPPVNAQVPNLHAVAGIRDGVVYAARSFAVGQSWVEGPVYALDAATGAILWESVETLALNPEAAGGFTADGHIVVSSLRKMLCLDVGTGALRWSSDGTLSDGQGSGVTVARDVVTMNWDRQAGSDLIQRDASDGSLLGIVPNTSAFIGRFHPVVDAQGRIYYPRRWDTCAGSSLTGGELRAQQPTGNGSYATLWTATILCSELTQVAVDVAGYAYTISPSAQIQKRDAQTGVVLQTSQPLGGQLEHASVTVDGAGYLYVYDPSAAGPSPRLWLLDHNLAEIPFPIAPVTATHARRNGGLALGGDGYLVISDLESVTAYRAPGAGASYCGPSVVNSTGQGARISLRGSHLLSEEDLVLRVDELPQDSAVLLLNARVPGLAPGAGGSLGVLCLGGNIGRFASSVLDSAQRGSVDLRVNLLALPRPNGSVPALAGQRWHFQAWYRDRVGGQPASNFSDAAAIVIQ